VSDGGLGAQLLVGVTLGCLYGLVALGYTLVFGTMRVIFFAQGDLCMVGAFAALGAASLLTEVPTGIRISLMVLAAVTAVLGVSLAAHRIAVKPFMTGVRTRQLVASLAVSLILQNFVMVTVSAGNLPFPLTVRMQAYSLFGLRVTEVQMLVIGLTGALVAGVWWILKHTAVGLQIRAVADNRQVAELDGIRVHRTDAAAFALAAVVAAIAGVMMGTYDGVAKYNMGFLPGIKGFTAAVLGGLGRPLGAPLGGLVLGVSEGLTAGYVSSSYRDVVAFAVLVTILVVRPRGILTSR
jgi:branched-chain amino acid transport system permease protein